MADRQKALEAVSQVLGDHELFDCLRTWSAWLCGTMREDDFVHAEDDPDIVESVLDQLEELGFVYVGPDRGTETQYGCEFDDGTYGRRAFVVDGQIPAESAAFQYGPSNGLAVQRTIITGPWGPLKESND